MNAVYADWAESMPEISLAAINHGISESKKGQHPPSQGEFIEHCKTYRNDNECLKLDFRITPEQRELNRKRIAEAVAELAKKNSGNSQIGGD